MGHLGNAVFHLAIPTPKQVDVSGIDTVMVFNVMLIWFFLYIIDAPVLTVDEHDGRTVGHEVDSHLLGEAIADMVFASGIAAQERTEYQQLEFIGGHILEKRMVEALVTILFACIDLQGLLLEPATVASMSSQAARLVDTCVVKFVKLEIGRSFPRSSALIIIA